MVCWLRDGRRHDHFEVDDLRDIPKGTSDEFMNSLHTRWIRDGGTLEAARSLEFAYNGVVTGLASSSLLAFICYLPGDGHNTAQPSWDGERAMDLPEGRITIVTLLLSQTNNNTKLFSIQYNTQPYCHQRVKVTYALCQFPK